MLKRYGKIITVVFVVVVIAGLGVGLIVRSGLLRPTAVVTDEAVAGEHVPSVRDYIPRKNMVKHFSGGFEDGGFTHTVGVLDSRTLQIQQIDTGTGVILMYHISDDAIRLVFSMEVPYEAFKDDHRGTFEENRDDIVLKSPLTIGNTWTNDEESVRKITGTNVRVETPAGVFETIEVTFRRGDFEMREYYAKDIGLVKRIMPGIGTDTLTNVQ